MNTNLHPTQPLHQNQHYGKNITTAKHVSSSSSSHSDHLHRATKIMSTTLSNDRIDAEELIHHKILNDASTTTMILSSLSTTSSMSQETLTIIFVISHQINKPKGNRNITTTTKNSTATVGIGNEDCTYITRRLSFKQNKYKVHYMKHQYCLMHL
jgi:hypothetical protein